MLITVTCDQYNIMINNQKRRKKIDSIHDISPLLYTEHWLALNLL